jgi:hypothetical protein
MTKSLTLPKVLSLEGGCMLLPIQVLPWDVAKSKKMYYKGRSFTDDGKQGEKEENFDAKSISF